MDRFEGHLTDPLSLHKYLYAHVNPVNKVDPSGNSPLVEQLFTLTENLLARGQKEKQTAANARRAWKSMCRIAAKMAMPYSKLKPKLEELNEKLRKANLPIFEAHHILKDAQMLTRFAADGYTTGLGLAVPLLGGTRYPGTPHAAATADQWKTRSQAIAVGGKAALLAAGCKPEDADSLINAAKAHVAFLGIKEKVLGR